MNAYTVAVQVCKIYHVAIEAANEDEARRIAEEMQSTQVADEGSLQNVETECVEVV